MRHSAFLAAAAVSFVSVHALADGSRAWSAARAGLPSDAKLVVGVDVAAAQKTQLFATYFPKLLGKADATKLVDVLKATCKIDPLVAVQGIVVATTADQDDGAAYIALSGLDKAKLSSCVQLTVQGKVDPSVKVSLRQNGNITEVFDGKDSTFFGWVGKDVVVVPLHAQDKTALAKWMGGQGGLAKSALGKALARVNTAAVLWGAGEANKELQPGLTMTRGYGAVTYAKGTLGADVHAVMATAAQATTMASDTNKQIAEAKQGMVPATVAGVLNALTVASANDEVVIKANLIETEVIGLLGFALAGVGGL